MPSEATSSKCAFLLLAVVAAIGSSCKEIKKYEGSDAGLSDSGQSDVRGGNGGSNSGIGTGGSTGRHDSAMSDAEPPVVDAPVVDGPEDLVPASDPSAAPTCTSGVPCSEGISPCRRGATTCATPTSPSVCADVGIDDSKGQCPGGTMCSNGSCVTPPPMTCTGQPIGSGRCNGTRHQTCGATGQWVDDNSPECKRADGGQCSTGSDCRSGNCARGVCCDSPCTGRCASCSAAETGGTNGNCAPVRAGTDPLNQCAVTPEASCGTDGACDGSGECRLRGTSVVCVQATCSNGTATPARQCNGQGTCASASGSTSCAPFPCGSNGQCATSCADRQNLIGGQCVRCGSEGDPCCDMGNPCAGDGSPQTPGELICNMATIKCQQCGRDGSACCGSQRTGPQGGATASGACESGPLGVGMCVQYPQGWSCE
jgi:hypothetical protein